MDKTFPMMMIVTSLLLSPSHAAAATDPNECADRAFITAWFTADSLDLTTKVWSDISGNNNHGGVSVNVEVATTNDDTNELYLNGESVVYGDTLDQVTFASDIDIAAEHTIFNLCKYRTSGSTFGRIIQSDAGNNLFGFHGGNSGVAHEEQWITESTDRFGKDWVLSTQQHALYRGNGDDFTREDYVGATATTVGTLTINSGMHTGELSDWACAEVIIVNEELPSAEYECIEEYFSAKYNLNFHDSCDALDIDSFLDHCSTLWDTRDDDVDSLSGAVEKNKDDIATNAGAITALDTHLSGEIDTNEGAITELDARLSGEIDVNEGAIAALTTRVTAVEDELAILANPVFPAQQVGLGALDSFGDKLDNNIFLFVSLITNVILLSLCCYMIAKLNKGVKYEKVRSFVDSDTDHQPLKH